MPTPHIDLEEHPYGIALLRDGEVMLTPKRSEIVVPNLALAEALAEEHRQVSTKEKPVVRHIAKLTNTTLDQVEDARDIITESMLAYLHTDTLCYVSDDPECAQYERKHWQPIIDWAEEFFTCHIEVFEGLMPGDQSEETASQIERHIESYNNWQLTALMDLTTGLSSLLLALAVMEGRLDTDQAFDCSIADETYQREKWGADEEAEAKREKHKVELRETARFLRLV